MVMGENQFIGRKAALYCALRTLSKKDDYPLLLVQGKGQIGKSRFVKEICRFLFMHNEFCHVIFFHDLSKIDSEEKFLALINKLSNIVKSQTISDGYA